MGFLSRVFVEGEIRLMFVAANVFIIRYLVGTDGNGNCKFFCWHGYGM